ncbi:ESX secretion-associated protein EspG [Nocardia brasiliensis]|uniref:ESX secretion-associated protein EspG n=1 Tax=Nocardia brasiliensis TaxID=37326 RepID=UPI00366D1840
MNRTWCFSTTEFVALWEELKEGALPAPFIYTTNTQSYDDHEREKLDTRQRVLASLDGTFEGVLETLARPDIRLVTTGSSADPDDAAALIRLLAARQDDRGYLVKQLPGETLWDSGGFVVTECDPVRLADAVIAELPEAKAGKQGEIVLAEPAFDDEDGFDYSYGRSSVDADTIENSIAHRSDRFLGAPVTTIGSIEIIQGRSRFGPRGIARYRLGWRDLVDDGRYVTVFTAPPVAVPADTSRMTALLNAEIIKVIQTIKDERG